MRVRNNCSSLRYCNSHCWAHGQKVVKNGIEDTTFITILSSSIVWNKDRIILPTLVQKKLNIMEIKQFQNDKMYNKNTNILELRIFSVFSLALLYPCSNVKCADMN